MIPYPLSEDVFLRSNHAVNEDDDILPCLLGSSYIALLSHFIRLLLHSYHILSHSIALTFAFIGLLALDFPFPPYHLPSLSITFH